MSAAVTPTDAAGPSKGSSVVPRSSIPCHGIANATRPPGSGDVTAADGGRSVARTKCAPFDRRTLGRAAGLPDALEICNKWFDEGHVITFFTSRTTAEHKQITEEWLDRHGFKYHGVLYDKPRGGNYHWIDDREVRATQYQGNFSELVERRATVQVFEPWGDVGVAKNP